MNEEPAAPIEVLQPVHPLMVQIIENNVLLKTAIEELKEIKVKQETNHVVALALTNHKTIERVDELWGSFGSFRFLLRVMAGLLALIPITAALLTAGHFLFGWPK